MSSCLLYLVKSSLRRLVPFCFLAYLRIYTVKPLLFWNLYGILICFKILTPLKSLASPLVEKFYFVKSDRVIGMAFY